MDYQSSTSYIFGKLIEFNKRFKNRYNNNSSRVLNIQFSAV